MSCVSPIIINQSFAVYYNCMNMHATGTRLQPGKEQILGGGRNIVLYQTKLQRLSVLYKTSPSDQLVCQDARFSATRSALGTSLVWWDMPQPAASVDCPMHDHGFQLKKTSVCCDNRYQGQQKGSCVHPFGPCKLRQVSPRN